MVKFVQRRNEPVVVQTVRSATAATLAYIAALWLLGSRPPPLLAPLTALLVVQVTLYATLTSGIRRVNAVVAGVLIAVGFSALVGLSWWSLGLLIISALVLGHVVRAGEFVPEVAISAMLVLGVSHATELALSRVLETVIGAVVGLLFNIVFLPPVWVESAGEEIEDLAGRMRRLLLDLGEEISGHHPVERAAERLHEARRLDHDVVEVDASLVRAEESVRLNPRVREGLLSRIVLRTGLDTLEICAVVLRVTARSITDLAKQRTEETLFPDEVSAALRELFAHMAGAVESYGVLITTQVSASAEEAEAFLATELSAARTSRDHVAHLLLATVQEHPRQWQLHGALLADIDRVLDELDTEKRALRLAEELDRCATERQDRHPRLDRWRQAVRSRVRVPRGAGG
ncbi:MULTISPECIES: FUSC family protein [unclassified Streptomyces]|uniref:FUSC family protein n=1 Tax=unclassified Streptomyces TaxID=2593676 RepID=UPI0022B5F6BF|nr:MULTISPECIES: aromatic acid exporter family protein [unclassified Streptomyces]MCZ7413207.1 aromatic acid exporter family protein [Streptomyces sp. WMMC897]MCZ7430200.1 aromatic acid exporter family protein [Streptomyces sp. WMMC1477]